MRNFSLLIISHNHYLSCGDHHPPSPVAAVTLVSSSQNNTPIYSRVLPGPGVSRQGVSSASTPALSHVQSRRSLEDGPSTSELTERGISAVHNFLVAHGGNYEVICNVFPDRARAMEVAWITNGVQNDGQHKYPHPSLVGNLRSKSWKSLRVSLKSLLFDSVSSPILSYSFSRAEIGCNFGIHRPVL